MIAAELVDELKIIIPEEQIQEGDQEHPLGNGGKVKVFPKTEEEIAEILQFAGRTGKKLNIEGSGTKRGFGGIAETADFLLSLTNYSGVVEHVPGDMTLTVKAGTNFKEVQDYLSEYRQMIPLDPFYPESATIGGILAANDSGPKRLAYGSARDTVIGLRVVYPDGKIIRTGGKVVKNVAGYDMNKLFIGSMGTLGVLSEVTLKLRPKPKYESLSLIHFHQETVEELRTFAIKLLDSLMEPITLELLSPRLSEKLTGQSCYTLAVGFEDIETSVRYQEKVVQNMLPSKVKLQILSAQEANTFWQEFYSIKQAADSSAILKIGVVNMGVINIIRYVQTLENSHSLTVQAHGGLGHGLCRVSLEGADEQIVSAISQTRDFVTKLGGFVVGTHLPFSLRKEVDSWGPKPTYFPLLEAIKSKVDPNRTLNPNRFIGGI